MKLIRRPGLVVFLLALVLVPEVVLTPATARDGIDVRRVGRVPLAFSVGWYDQVYKPSPFADVAAEGMNTLLPYGSGNGIGRYLNAANAAKLGVFVPIDPERVKAADVAGVTKEVDTYKKYPAVRGWYLADEPTFNHLDPATAIEIYNAIKLADSVHPVAIAFNVGEYALPYASAMDVMMWDDYPFQTRSHNFANLGVWRADLLRAAKRWRTNHRFVPIIQAFGVTGAKYRQYRLPTAAEERYMVYASLQAGVDGMFFWARYAAAPSWLENSFDPLMAEVRGLLPAIKDGPSAPVRVDAREVSATIYRDPSTKRFVLLALNNVSRTTTTTVTLPTGRRLPLSFGAFEVKVVRV